MPLRQVKYYQIALIAAAVGLVIWQFLIVSNVKTADTSAPDVELSFTTNTGEQITIPGSLDDRYAVVIFWNASSARSSQQINEALKLFKEQQLDTLATLYLVNYGDSLQTARSAVDFDNPDMPFGRSPKGQFLIRYPIRSLPVTAIFSPEGQLVDKFEGYREGQIAEILARIEMFKSMTNRPGGIRFQLGGGTK